MPSAHEYNQFRRLIGDYGVDDLENSEIDSWLDDSAVELTGNFSTPLMAFDLTLYEYHTEIVYKAALNWWWDQLSKLQGKHSMTMGTMSQQVSEKWQRAMDMIKYLQAWYDSYQTLGRDIHTDNSTRFSKLTLRRLGGVREEDTPGFSGGNTGHSTNI